MPNCFQLIRKADGKPATFHEIDAEMCAFFGVPCDPVRWYLGWYDIVGLALACGRTFADLLAAYKDYYAVGGEQYDFQMTRVINFLDMRFTPNAWAEVGRR